MINIDQYTIIPKPLSTGLEVLWEELEVLGERSLLGQELDVSTIVSELVLLLESKVVGSVERSESPLSGDDDLLLTWELVSASSESLDDGGSELLLGSDGDKNLADGNSGGSSVWLTPGTSHTLLESISTGTRKHLVDSQNVEWVDSDSHVESLSASVGRDVLVGANTGGLESLRGELLDLVGHKVDTEWEGVNWSVSSTKIKDLNLWVWNTSVVSRLWERLVLAVSVASSWSSSHLEC